MDPRSWLLEPLRHDFMVRALLVSALVAGVCGVLSCFMNLKGWALMGDAVSHAVMPGVVIAYALNLPFALGAFVFGVGSVAAIGYIKQVPRIKEDAVSATPQVASPQPERGELLALPQRVLAVGKGADGGGHVGKVRSEGAQHDRSHPHPLRQRAGNQRR